MRENNLATDFRRSSHSEVFLGKAVLKICRKFTGEHPCRSAISIKLGNCWGNIRGGCGG